METIAAGVHARQQSVADTNQSDNRGSPNDLSGAGLSALIGQSIKEAFFASDDSPPNAGLTVAEELAEHVVYEGLSLDAVAEIEANSEKYPGVRLLRSFRREYPAGTLAAHLVGYLSATTEKELEANVGREHEWVGRAGIERQYEPYLRGRPGVISDQIDLHGKVVASNTLHETAAGLDLISTLEPNLQRVAEELIDQGIARRIAGNTKQQNDGAGGALVAIDIYTGAILAAASAPRFDPNAFVQGSSQPIQQWRGDAARPLFDRTLQMALPPGSVFKVISASALLEAGVDPLAPVDCEGYLHQPDALRCAIFRRFGIGHGRVNLSAALARSCNVYFFHHAEQIGTQPLVECGRRFGLGQISGIDLPGEVPGSFPAVATPADKTIASVGDNGGKQIADDPRMISIGQGPVTTTPLQVARIFAAIANGGYLVRPHVVQKVASSAASEENNHLSGNGPRYRFDCAEQFGVQNEAPVPIPGLNLQILAVIREGLRQAVANEDGTAHATVDLEHVAIAGKTGTAEVGAHRAEHAWFAGYAPADQPQIAFVVVL
ncbi:MAG TPA: penicillin-binding transpeptidase domain-containing protein, partial [Pirellulales bacterium]